MIRFAVDEDFNNDVVRALGRNLPDLDIVGVREAGHGGWADPDVLTWAAEEGRVLLTHDVTTMTGHALERVARGDATSTTLPIGSRWCTAMTPGMTCCSWPPAAFLPTGSIRSISCHCDRCLCSRTAAVTIRAGVDYYAEADDGLLTALVPLRAELMCGDFRVAYLAWLLALQAGEVDQDATEPPLPPDLSNLTAAQQAMVDFLRLDRDLLTAAAAASPAPTNDSAAARRWVHALAPSAKNSWLERAIREPGLPLGTELLRAFRQENTSHPRRPGRRVAELLATAEELRAKRVRAPARRPSRSSAATAKPQKH